MNSMKLVIPLHSWYWSIHTKDESKRVPAFAFIFGVNWLMEFMCWSDSQYKSERESQEESSEQGSESSMNPLRTEAVNTYTKEERGARPSQDVRRLLANRESQPTRDGTWTGCNQGTGHVPRDILVEEGSWEATIALGDLYCSQGHSWLCYLKKEHPWDGQTTQESSKQQANGAEGRNLMEQTIDG